jgi:hypothetical protein
VVDVHLYPKLILPVAAAVLYVMGSLFMRNTHPYAGSRRETFESKQARRRIGTTLIVSATLLLGIAGLTQLLISKN